MQLISTTASAFGTLSTKAPSRSVVVPFVVRAVFGAEFRKQLGGNILVGAILLIVCGVLSNVIIINEMAAGLGTISTLIALPLFVWMLAIRQRSWD